MEKSKWSEYSRYIALSDNSSMDLKGNYQLKLIILELRLIQLKVIRLV